MNTSRPNVLVIAVLRNLALDPQVFVTAAIRHTRYLQGASPVCNINPSAANLLLVASDLNELCKLSNCLSARRLQVRAHHNIGKNTAGEGLCAISVVVPAKDLPKLWNFHLKEVNEYLATGGIVDTYFGDLLWQRGLWFDPLSRKEYEEVKLKWKERYLEVSEDIRRHKRCDRARKSLRTDCWNTAVKEVTPDELDQLGCIPHCFANLGPEFPETKRWMRYRELIDEAIEHLDSWPAQSRSQLTDEANLLMELRRAMTKRWRSFSVRRYIHTTTCRESQ
jgi:hypothetical protein